ncbi:hypothetical protein ACVWWI_004110 [Bradyrhizobium sp. USDA 3686]
MAGPFRDGGNVQIDLAVPAHARRAQIDLVLVDRCIRRTHLVDQRQQGAAKRHQLFQRLPLQELRRDIEEGFGCDVGGDDFAVRPDHQHGIGKCVQDGIAVGRKRPTMFSN